jgi:hypothetical protein
MWKTVNDIRLVMLMVEELLPAAGCDFEEAL